MEEKSLGQILRSARETKKISKKEMASLLVITENNLSKFEEDEYINVKNLIYTKMLARKYARLIGMEDQEINNLITHFFEENEFEKTMSQIKEDQKVIKYSGAVNKSKKINRKRSWKYIIITIAFIIAILLVVFNIVKTSYLIYEKNQEMAQNEQAIQNQEDKALEEAVGQEDQAPNENETNITPQGASVATFLNQEGINYNYEINTQDPYKISLTATTSCYYDISVDGEIVQTATLKEGETAEYEVTGKNTIINIGNIYGVKISINGNELLLENIPSAHIYINLNRK